MLMVMILDSLDFGQFSVWGLNKSNSGVDRFAILGELAGVSLGGLGIVANCLLLALVYRSPSRRRRFNAQLVPVIALIDLAMGLAMVGMDAVQLLGVHNHNFATSNPRLAMAVAGVVRFVLPITSLVLVGLLARDRYQAVMYNQPLTPRAGWASALCIIAPIFLAVAAYVVLGSGPNVPARLGGTQSYQTNPTTLLVKIIATFLVLTLLLLITHSYLSIFKCCYGSDCPNPRYFTSRKLSYRFLVLTLIYHVCWGPKLTTTILDFLPFSILPPQGPWNILSDVTWALTLSANPIVAMTLQGALRSQLQAWLGWPTKFDTNDGIDLLVP